MKKPSLTRIQKFANRLHDICTKHGYYNEDADMDFPTMARQNGLIIIGDGCTRIVMAFPELKGVVFKISFRDWGGCDFGGCNISEGKVWERLKETKARKSLAEVYGVYFEGAILAMQYVDGVRVDDMNDITPDDKVRAWNNLRRQALTDLDDWAREVGITLADLHGENIMMRVTHNNTRPKFIAVDYGGAYKWNMPN